MAAVSDKDGVKSIQIAKYAKTQENAKFLEEGLSAANPYTFE